MSLDVGPDVEFSQASTAQAAGDVATGSTHTSNQATSAINPRRGPGVIRKQRLKDVLATLQRNQQSAAQSKGKRKREDVEEPLSVSPYHEALCELKSRVAVGDGAGSGVDGSISSRRADSVTQRTRSLLGTGKQNSIALPARPWQTRKSLAQDQRPVDVSFDTLGGHFAGLSNVRHLEEATAQLAAPDRKSYDSKLSLNF